MTSGAKVAAALWAAAILWDLRCPPRQTVSHALSRGIRDEHTRVPVSAVIVATVLHLFVLAWHGEEPA